ncbi:MAG: sugar-binding domain-containing protein [Candidatus Hodarchaeota archaeon]
MMIKNIFGRERPFQEGRKRRFFKVELVSPVLNLPFVAIFLILMYSNVLYWDLFNATLSGAFGITMDWVGFIIVTMFSIGAVNIVIFIIGLIKIRILHKGKFPILLVIPAATILFMVSFLMVLINVEERVNLDYIFFMLGEAAFPVYLGASMATFVILLIIVFSCVRLWTYPREWMTRREKQITMKPRFAAITTLVTSGTTAYIIWMICFKYAVTDVFWKSFGIIYTAFVPWLGIGMIIWFSAIAFTLALQARENKLITRGKNLFKISLVVGGVCQVMGIILAASEFPIQDDGIWWTLLPMMIPVSIISLVPTLLKLKKTLITRKLKQEKLNKLIKAIGIVALCFAPYFFTFYVPLWVTAPSVAVKFNERMVILNNILVPFQGDVVYPSFETQPTTPNNVSGGSRYTFDLGGAWKWHFSDGSKEQSLYMRTDSVIASLTQGQHLPGYDDSGWTNITLPRPNCFPYWSGVEDDKRYGVHWYRKEISVPATFANHQLMLKFYGGGYMLDLWINGEYVGYHEVTQFQFVFDVTDYIMIGQENVIAIRIDDPAWEKTTDVNSIWFDKHIPAYMDFFKYGGLIREINLEALPVASISRVDVKVLDQQTTNHTGGNASVQVDVVMHCPESGILSGALANITLGMYPLDFPNDTALGSRKTWNYANFSDPVMPVQDLQLNLAGANNTAYTACRFILSLENMSFWSTKSPNLYLVAANLTIPSNSTDPFDTFFTQTGFRTLDTAPDQILLNGADLKLGGAAILEEMWDPYGQSVEDWQILMKLQLLKNVSVNFIRMSSYPFHPNWYLFAERMGITSWCESPTCWMNEIDFTQLFIRDAIEPIWIQTVFPNINRPGIIFWGGPNEPWAADDCIRFLQVSNEFLNEIDGTRFFGYAAVSSHTWHTGFKDANLPILTMNNYGGTFDGERYAFYNETIKSLEAWTSNNPGKPLVTLEFGYWQEAVWNGSAWVPNYDNQIKCLNETLQAFMEFNASGLTWWIGFDYTGYGQDSWYNNGMGVYNLDGTFKKPSADVMNTLYGNFTSGNL